MGGVANPPQVENQVAGEPAFMRASFCCPARSRQECRAPRPVGDRFSTLQWDGTLAAAACAPLAERTERLAIRGLERLLSLRRQGEGALKIAPAEGRSRLLAQAPSRRGEQHQRSQVRSAARAES